MHYNFVNQTAFLVLCEKYVFTDSDTPARRYFDYKIVIGESPEHDLDGLYTLEIYCRPNWGVDREWFEEPMAVLSDGLDFRYFKSKADCVRYLRALIVLFDVEDKDLHQFIGLGF